ncbi:MAG TPA: hypothetical protein VNW15_07650 [Rhizomicrobium sp.]|jgi:hypothetical protein|nr:hypothetical protein [Rhizomicrobium sp.]
MRNLSVALLALGLAGCDTANGVRRSADLDSFPSLDCVRTVVSSAPGVVKSEYRQDEGGTAITLSGLKPEGPTHTITYVGTEESQIWGALQIHQDVRGGISFWQSLIEINAVPPQKAIDASRPVMRQIEFDLASKCGLPELPARVKEWCQRVQCSSLH